MLAAEPTARPAPGRLAGRAAYALTGLGALLLVGTAALGPSAAQPSLGPRGWLPPWSLDAGISSGLVTVLLDAGYVLGAVGVLCALVAVRRGALPDQRRLRQVAVVVGVLAVLVPPLGSADHVNYAAYGRIAAAGGDPYVEPPAAWAGGTDPVTSAVEPPWTTTPSVYGPVATALQAAASILGGDSLRATVWAWQLLCLGGWLLVGLLLDRLTRPDPAARARATWLWLANPVLLGLLVLGAHVDVLAVAFGTAALALTARHPLWAGVALGAAVGSKLTLVLLGPAILWALRHHGLRGWLRSTGLGLAGAALVLVPAHLWAGLHVFDQLGRARRFVSLATPWRPLVDGLTGPLSSDTVRDGVAALTPVAVLLLAVAVGRALRHHSGRDPVRDVVTDDAARAALVLGAAYVLAAPYSLPWYDALALAPLALVAAGPLDTLLVTRVAVYAVAYVPGRVLGMSEQVRDLTLGWRREVTPWLGVALLVALVVLAVRRPRPERVPTG